VEVRGHRVVRHQIDGAVVLEYNDPQLDPSDADGQALIARNGGVLLSSGTISLQSESHPVQFRKVELLPLDDAP
jgi:hypothetical protein